VEHTIAVLSNQSLIPKQTMNNKMKSAVLALLAASVAGVASAAEPVTPKAKETHQRALFARLDANDDGKVTEREYAVVILWDEFVRYDADKNGKITKAEYEAREKAKNIWDDLDPKGKGYITFKDCFKSKEVIDDLRTEWRSLTSKLGKGTKGVRYFTLADLPDLTP
jgi:hypothetical protein